MPEPLRMPTGLLLQLEAPAEVAESTFEIGQHPAMQGAERRVDPLCNLDAPLEILPAAEVARESPRDTSRCERTSLQLLQLECLGIDQSLRRDRDRPFVLSGQTEEERKLDEHFDLHARELTVLDERQRAMSMLEHDVQRLAALMREISEERRSLGSGLSIAGGEEHALGIREDIRALGVRVIARLSEAEEKRRQFEIVLRPEVEGRTEVTLCRREGIERQRPAAGLSEREPRTVAELPSVGTRRPRELVGRRDSAEPASRPGRSSDLDSALRATRPPVGESLHAGREGSARTQRRGRVRGGI